MTHLRETLALHFPYTRAWHYLNLALSQMSQGDEPSNVRLRLPLAMAAGPALQKDVTLKYRHDADAPEESAWSVYWQPVGGPYPDFDGLLTIDVGEDHLTPVLVLEGEYEPPLGAVGHALDSVLGARVAGISARELLRSIGTQMERQYITDEAQAGRV